MDRLTDMALRKMTGTPGETKTIAAGGGLQLWVTVNQAGNTLKSWVLRYYDADGKRQKARIGTYPDLSLAKAQALAEDLKAQAKTGANLAQERRKARRVIVEENTKSQEAEQNTFMDVAEAWLQKKALSWVPGHLKRQRERLQGHLYHALGNMPVSTMTMNDVDTVIMPLVKEGKIETAKRACDLIRNVLEHADLMGMLENASLISKISRYRREIPTSPAKRHFYQEMSEEQIAALLLALEESKGRWTKATSVAGRLAPYVFLRASELCGAEWSEIDLDKAEWLIPAERMKSRREHLVPLSRQALALFEEIRPLSGGGKYVFPSQSKRNEPISTNALIQVLRRLGYKSTREEGETFVTHAFRGMASTTLYQKLQYPGDYIEHQLAHVEPNKVKLAYNQINARSYLEERRTMMQEYANYLDSLRERAKKGW
jgi:integrase